MTDDKSNRGEPDRSRVSGSEEYEVDYLARKHDITAEQARELIRKYGGDRERLDMEAAALRRA